MPRQLLRSSNSESDDPIVTVVDSLRSRIAAEGPVPFDVFMETALYGPDGFFTSGPLRSAATGDFLTSPEVSPWFGKTIGRFAATAIRRLLGDRAGAAGTREVNHPLNIVEVGAGSGSLLQPLLAEIHSPVEAWAVETSPMARESLSDLLPVDRIVYQLSDLPAPLSGVIVANELIDNLPVALALRSGDGWVEHSVGRDGDGFVFVETPVRPEVAEWADRFGGEVPAKGIVEVQLAAAAWLEQAVDSLEAGVILLIDYGGTIEELEPRRQQGTLRTYRGHHLGPDPLLEPGTTDITVDVNFTALQTVAKANGAGVSLHRQDDFLSEWGLRRVVSDMRHRELELARAGETMQQLQIKSDRIAAEALLHPRGLGDFRVLVVEV
jgi:SAM-dependent MidA family methyltransferase